LLQIKHFLNVVLLKKWPTLRQRVQAGSCESIVNLYCC